ncbi:hypothetical protein RhiirA4_549853 [Rhizophagus irregularis]|uniref:Ion transport domain-containing protein n=1 Tax=Rhizophagus irregularis TaxID=588596 RepID=A0A2I1HGA9_9GLOM|nr:hypothetical protein RhiirA4_549853 [Rhizophagus irregularis]
MSDITVETKNSNIDNIDEIKIDHDDEIKGDVDIDIDEIKIDDDIKEIKIDNDNGNDIDKPHKGEPITKIEISPNEEYLVTYSKYDHSIAGWNINECPFKPELSIKLASDKFLCQICVSDDKKLAYIDYNEYLEICDMNSKQKIILDCGDNYKYNYYTFTLKGEFILREMKDNFTFIYSTQTKNNKLNCKRIYKIPEGFDFISISKYDKLYLFSNNSIYEHDLITQKSIRIFKNDKIELISYELKNYISYDKNIIIGNDENFIYIRINNKIIIYSIDFKIPFVSLDINNINDVIQLHNFMNRTCLIPSLIPLLSGSIIKELYWDKCLDRLKEKGQLSKERQARSLLNKIRTTTKYVFGIQDGHILKIKHEEILAKNSSKFEIPNEIIENWYVDDDFEDWYFDDDKKETYKTDDLLNIIFNNKYMDTIHALFQKIDCIVNEEVKLTQNSIVLKLDKGIINLKVFRNNNTVNSQDQICAREENINADQYVLGFKLFNESDIIILTTIGLFIYHFNENNKSISLNYYYYMNISPIKNYYSEKDNIIEQLKSYKEKFSKPTLPLSNYDSLKHYDKWETYIKDNKERLLKYGVELLTSAVKEHNLNLIEDIYKKCINYFKEDLRNNRMFLSIITSTMALLNKSYPDYISRYSSETTMITDSSFYSIENKNINLHLYSSSEYPQIINLTKSIWWCKYNLSMSEFAKEEIFEHTTTQTIIFMNPYIKFVNYPQKYNWFKELIKPQYSPFVETINKDIYKTWNGETLIDFKWNNYGKYYYTLIWIVYMTFLGCFTAAATIPQQYIDEDTQIQLLIASIILGFIHLSFEIRQFIYNPIRWFRNFWNIFDMIAFLFPIGTSIYWMQTNNRNIHLISFSCLFLDIKFMLFFRVFESFGVYFAIMISVGKQIASFLVVLFIIIISFAHTFYILLSPTSNFSFEKKNTNDDPNNPWNIAPAYYQVFADGTVNQNQYFIQPPNGNTNMFVDFGTAIFAMYLFLTGDSSALSNWTYKDNSSLVVLIVLFSLLVVVYLMNLLIGLLNNAIEKDNNKASYLVQKAEILAEIELFYLLPHQRRWRKWFPEVIYYYADVYKVRQKIKEMINEGEWNTGEFSELKQDLLNKINIQHNPVDETTLKNILEEIRDLRSKLSQQQ